MDVAPTIPPHEAAGPAAPSIERKGGNRNTFVDLARMFAALGVVTLHVPHGTPEGKVLNQIFWVTCVPFFYIAGILFFVKSLKVGEIGQAFLKLGKRLMVPYLVWTVVYLALLQSKAVLVHKPRAIDWLAALLYGQSSVQLYFVPTLFFFLVLAAAYAAVRSAEARIVWQGCLLFAAGVSYFVVGYQHGYYGEGSLGYFAGIAIYLLAAHGILSLMKGSAIPRQWAVFGLILWLSCAALNIFGIRLVFLNSPLLLPLGGLGFCLFALGDWVKISSDRIVAILGTSYGIYLSHVLFLEMIEFGISKTMAGSLKYTLGVKVGVTLIVFFAALVFTLLVRRFKLGSILLLGEAPAGGPLKR